MRYFLLLAVGNDFTYPVGLFNSRLHAENIGKTFLDNNLDYYGTVVEELQVDEYPRKTHYVSVIERDETP